MLFISCNYMYTAKIVNGSALQQRPQILAPMPITKRKWDKAAARYYIIFSYISVGLVGK